MMIAIKLWIQTPCRPDSPKTNTDHPILPARPYIVVVKPAGGKPHPGERGNKSHRHRDKPDTGTHSRERKEKKKIHPAVRRIKRNQRLLSLSGPGPGARPKWSLIHDNVPPIPPCWWLAF